MGKRISQALRAGARGLLASVAALAGSLTLFVLTVLSIAFVPLGVGLLTTPAAVAAVRRHANRRRVWAAEWAGVRVAEAYRPLPADVRRGLAGQVRRTAHLLRDPATWRDLRWLLVDASAGTVSAMLAPALFAYGVQGFVLAAGLWAAFRQDPYWYAFVPVSGPATGLLAAALGAVLLGAGVRYAPDVLRGHFLLTRSLLDPGRDEELARRVERLTRTRHDAVDASAGELRRIERDLHDGAQARLVAVGMDLGVVEALIEKDPARAKELIGQARRSSADALNELRDLVRGIHPPVLAERGLGDAVRALALRMPVATEVSVDLPGRAQAPVESAAYFTVSEALANAVKHAGAGRVRIDLWHSGGVLRATVTDDGRGGARIGNGSGLSGLERRLGTFDGVLAVSSPAGGPTVVTMEIPCELS
ncbi:sensor histidine kinase [Streptomyces fuscigenes]|uniref:sensor histidine kinase n=1 Tax=Streptomyces fuscigenes TaxID=1528880 RepID=UPI001F2DBDB8|nr:sensor domain-containing protein [Streptomyces fuscigenes]MCF3963318.1 sensor domain-containing protein [Streptomyces fuscigenes]